MHSRPGWVGGHIGGGIDLGRARLHGRLRRPLSRGMHAGLRRSKDTSARLDRARHARWHAAAFIRRRDTTRCHETAGPRQPLKGLRCRSLVGVRHAAPAVPDVRPRTAALPSAGTSSVSPARGRPLLDGLGTPPSSPTPRKQPARDRAGNDHFGLHDMLSSLHLDSLALNAIHPPNTPSIRTHARRCIYLSTMPPQHHHTSNTPIRLDPLSLNWTTTNLPTQSTWTSP